jgi:hypothetical protein
MEVNLRCQSCGMPLGEGLFGSNQDGSVIEDYCKFCFDNGDFTDPGLDLERMIEISVHHMQSELKIPEVEARELAKNVLPGLKRWQNKE